MRTGDAHARVARLRRSATAFQNVYAAFAPWQHLSTGIAELDALLNAAGVGSEGSSGGDGGHSHHINAGASGCRAGGLPVGGLHELYGPPLSGKSFLLRRIATTYTRRMTAFRQWCLDEMVRDETWWTMSTADRDEQGKEPQTGEETRHSNAGPSPKVLLKSTSNNAAAAGVPYAPTVAVCDWDLYVCLVRGTTLAPDNPSSATFFSAEVLSWQEQIINALPTPSPVCGCAKGETNGEHGASAVPVPSQQQLQRDYVAGHCHVCVVSTPNELLALLNALLTTENSGQKVSYPPSDGCCTSSSSFTAQQSQQQKPPTTDAADGAPNTTTGKVQRKRSRSSSADKCECTPLPPLLIPSPSSSRVPKRLWDLQKQRLLLVDGLDQLWLHPSFGTHSGTHTGQWFSMELHRLLRCFLTPQCLEAPAVPAEDDSRRRNPLVNCSFSVYSTVVATNGYQGGGFGLHTQQQLQDRLRSFPVIPTQEQKNKGRISSTSLAASAAAVLPRPAGNPVWWMAVDTRCLVEPAHPGLVSLPSSTPSSFRSTSGSHAETQPPSSTSETQRRAARSPRAIVSSLSFGPSREEAEAAVEMHVTVVLGGSRVCAGWVERRDDKEGEGGKN
ncbi:hypothetical protein ABB37_07460 [Leptomonas pyrrhocoris]|uniref:Uncharacterized protein n=1 Tax=Leptomonas pyrrhocoris TaxID=157538 RepID=A0A0N0DSW3_LEPPY|nr:hypothetical protein ABB37_07460 [Leptomonas pyrrhocoris]XP_015655030.1 hypothetical protein ABB37_07460 [Leptomonas pyrrhocoris]KPA76590.1 hypothetical protein ABB37_07460 [Leptomonas pyrrhocoris]KPA76591.1 hypothetical protein ABB37_07460 [Leptomonas pyrrhocoris]|eukprot:XP_015655029.1 hypothetical protein ABB37_07460 [Leptomonas pyrrhocoris]